MKNKDLFSLYQGLKSVGKLVGVTFGYAVNKNLRTVKTELELLEETLKPSEKYTEFLRKQEDIVRKYAKKNETGEFIMQTTMIGEDKKYNYDIKGSEEEVAKEIKPLREEYKEVLEAREAQEKAYTELLEKESDFKPYTVKKEDLPKEITGDQMASIFDIIEE